MEEEHWNTGILEEWKNGIQVAGWQC